MVADSSYSRWGYKTFEFVDDNEVKQELKYNDLPNRLRPNDFVLYFQNHFNVSRETARNLKRQLLVHMYKGLGV